MWIGTRNGLNRYDGHSFKVFLPGAGNSITNEIINDIEEDSRGRIWVATMEGLSIYDPATGTWETMIPDPEKRANGLPNYIIWDILIDNKDIVWVASDVFEFTRYDMNTRKFTFYDWPDFARNHPAMKDTRYHSIQRFVSKGDGLFWLGTTNGLVSLDTKTKEFRYAGGGFYGDVIDVEYDPRNKKVFICEEKGRVYLYDENAYTYKEMAVVPEPYPSTEYTLPGKEEIWMASPKGLVKISDDRKKIRLERNVPQLSASLLPGGVRSVFEDDNHIKWIATANGVSVYDPKMSAASFLPLLAFSDKEGANGMGGVYYDAVSGCYFACSVEPAAVFIIDTHTGTIDKVVSDARGNPFAICTGIKTDNAGELWLLTGNHVYQYNRSSKKFTLFPTPNKNDDVVFRDMLQDEEGNYWFGSFNRALFYYKTAEKKFMILKDSSFFKLNTITGIDADLANHTVVISSFGQGVFTYHIPTGKINSYYETAEVQEYSQLNLVNGSGNDSKGGVWLATNSGGVSRYNPGMPFEKSFTRFDMKHGLSSNNILSVCSNRDSILWLLSGKGISAISTSGQFLYELKEEQAFNFSAYASDGRNPHDISFDSVKNELLVGVGGGLFIYSPPDNDNVLRFPLAITSIKINGKTLTPEEINRQPDFRLPFHSNSVSFEFAGLYYGIQTGIQYEYKLEGHDPDWVDAGKSFSAAYQNLPSGYYQFLVRAKASSGTIAGKVSGFYFKIVPPFWRTWWFILLAGLAVAFSIWLIIYSLQQKLNVEKMINAFATSLYGQNTTDDIFWDTARNCIEKLGFIDCVIYQRNENRQVLEQKAAYGPKNPHRREIVNIIEIPVGKGIVGTVAQTGRAIISRDTTKDPRYIVDDLNRLSEIAVPVLVDGKVFAVIDSEHPQKNFYRRYHLRVLKKIAAICSERITKHLTEERLRTKIARDLHDEMGSTLTSINIISKVAMEEKQEPEKLKQYFQKIKDHSGRMMESMSDMVWAINPVNDSFDNVLLRMKEFTAEMLEPARIQFAFTEEGSLDMVPLNLEQRKDIYMIFKEAVNNIVKYSEATAVSIAFNNMKEQLHMTITDNGKGFDHATVTPGNGLRNMASRAEEMGATLHIEAIPGSGTAIALILPLP